MGEQTLVRLEALEWPLLQLWDIGFEDLQACILSRQQPDSAQTLATWLAAWNRGRDNRPAFAAFLDEIEDDAGHADWPHRLRDRLGLGSYSPRLNTRIPVAQMRYTLQEVFNAQALSKVPTACALPAALDGGMHEFFFPVPREHPYGATLNLATGQADRLTAEIIHCRIDYQPRHLWQIGWIDRPHSLTQGKEAASESVRQGRLREARDLHLLQLQIATEREDFGEDMGGRT